MKYVIFALTGLFLAIPCYADMIIVDDDWPADFNNIQAAIDYSANGDIIYVFPGTYSGQGNYNIDFSGKAVTVQGVDPLDPYIVAATVVDCNDVVGPYPAFDFESGEDANSVLAGLKITNAAYGAIRCYASNPTIANCLLTGNSNADGGAIYCDNSSPTIKNCTITDNTVTSGRGGGIYCDNSSPTITDCNISHNTSAYEGGGIYGTDSSSLTINNCKIIGNSTTSAMHPGGGI
jgi:parallel beta-helix repeat protein